MNVTTMKNQPGKPRPSALEEKLIGGPPAVSSDQRNEPELGDDLSRLTHNLMGSISALLMCEHMVTKELAPSSEMTSNPTLKMAMHLLKQTADQIREYGENLMVVSHRYQKLHPSEAEPV